MTKNEIRKNMIKKRNLLSKETVEKNSAIIIEKFDIYIRKAENIMIFMNMTNEVEIAKLTKIYSDNVAKQGNEN